MTSYPISLPLDSETPMATLHHPTSTTWEFEMHHGVDNRLTGNFLVHCLSKALDIIERDWRIASGDAIGTPGALIISGKQDQGKFFSNGLDWDALQLNPNFFHSILNPILTRLFTFPLPTVAAINGHAFAGASILSLACDYRVMQRAKGWGSMNEVFFGGPISFPFATILNYKLPTPQAVRAVVLEGKRLGGQELYDLGVVDVLAENGAGVLNAARDLANRQADLAKTGVWGSTKREVMRDMLARLNADHRVYLPAQDAELIRVKL